VVAAISLAAGVMYTASMVGVRCLNPTDVSWLRADSMSHYLGWTFMRQDPVTALPLTFTDRVGYPLTVSAAHFDIVPMIAISLLPFSRILPAEFQYFGLLQATCAAALFYWGHEISRLFGKSEVMAIGAGALAMTNSVFTMRLGVHSALTAQFFLLWFIYEFLKRFAPTPDEEKGRGCASRRFGLVVGICGVVVALGVNPYIAAMMVLFWVAYVLELVIVDRTCIPFAIGVCAASPLVLALATWFYGYFGHAENSLASGFSEYSANMNSYVNPLGSRFFPLLAVQRPEQMEGLAYVGAPVGLALVAAVVGIAVSPRVRAQLKPLRGPFGAGVVAFVFSLSDRITLGDKTVAVVPLPPTLREAISIFRTSGRFSWPLFYVGLAGAIATIGILVPPRAQGACALLLAIGQFFELAPLREGVRGAQATTPRVPARLASESFRRLGEVHRHLVVLPAWQCGPLKSPGGDAGFATFGLLATRQRMTTNSYYSSRYSDRANRVHCRDLPAELLRRGPAADTAYVVDSEFLRWFEVSAPSHECGDRDGFHLCVRRGALY
jgi:hypothetical protein